MKDKIKNIQEEALACLRTIVNPKSYWIYCPALMSVASVYLAYNYDIKCYLVKGYQENSALIIVGLTITLLFVSVLKSKRFTPIFFIVLAVNFLIRELDDTPINIPHFVSFNLRTKTYIYIALGIMAAWGIWKEKKIISYLNEFPIIRTMFLGIFTTYLTSQLIAQRVFKHIQILPHEQHLHVPLEEITENFAHTFFLAMAVVILWYSFTSKKITKNSDNQ